MFDGQLLAPLLLTILLLCAGSSPAAEADAAAAVEPAEVEETVAGLRTEGEAPGEALAASPGLTVGFTGDFVAELEGLEDYGGSFRAGLWGLRTRLGVPLDEGCHLVAELELSRSSSDDDQLTCEEAYFSWPDLARGEVRLGLFRQAFGRVSRLTRHEIDWTRYPLALDYLLRYEWDRSTRHLAQAGLSYEFKGSSGGLTLQVTNGRAPPIFYQNDYGWPSVLARFECSVGSSAGTGLDVGLSGLVGWNDGWWYVGGSDEHAYAVRPASAACLDLTLRRGPWFRWETELYAVTKGILRPDGLGEDVVSPWGAHTSITASITPTVELGLKYDYYQPSVRPYLHFNYTSPEESAHRWLAGVRLAWRASDTVTFRAEYTHSEGRGVDVYDTYATEGMARLTFQCVFKWGWDGDGLR